MLQYGETALHKAVEGGHVEVVKMLVKYGAVVDIRNKVTDHIRWEYSIVKQTITVTVVKLGW